MDDVFARKGTFVCLGGGGFSYTGRDSKIDDYLLELSGKSMPKMCFIPTASGDADGYSERFEEAFRHRATTSVLTLFNHQPWGYQHPEMLLDQDIIYVGGGSTLNLLALWRAHGLPSILRQAMAGGVILAGISAGMNCWFEACSTDSYGELAPLDDGLGFLPGGACPHYREEEGRRERLHEWVGAGKMPATLAVDAHAAAVFRDGVLAEVVNEQHGQTAFRVHAEDGRAIEEALTVQALN